MINIKLLLEELKNHEGWGRIIATLLESDINAIDKKAGNNALYLVILDSLGKNIELITFLINNGINIDHKNYLGNTALWYSVDLGYPAVVRILLEHGADIESKNIENVTPAILLQNEMRINQINLKQNYDKIAELLSIAKIVDQTIDGSKLEEQNLSLFDNNEEKKLFVNRFTALANKNNLDVKEIYEKINNKITKELAEELIKGYEIFEQTKVEHLGKNNIPDDI